MTGILQALLMGRGAAAAATDADFEYVTMLLPGNGTNGAQNNTFLDSSTNNFTITRNGNTTQGTFTPYGDNWSNYFDGSGDNLSISDNTAFEFGSGDFTVEFWVNTTQTGYKTGVSKWQSGQFSWMVRTHDDADGKWQFFYSTDGSNYTQIAGADINDGKWHHIAVSRSGSNIRLFTDGTLNATNTNNPTLYNGTASVVVGSDQGTNDFLGYISNLRVVKGTAVYTAAFTPPTAPLTAITNTSLLTCQSNRFIDNSTNAFTITRNGDVSVQRFSPFSPTAAYASGTIGGSGYFDGASDYLSLPYSSELQFTGDFTVEFWAYPLTQLNSAAGVFNNYSSWPSSTGFAIFCGHSSASSTKWCVALFGTFPAITSTNDYIRNAWSHVALVRNGTGTNNITLYVNGVASGSATSNNTVTGTANNWWIATTGDLPASQTFTGYLSGFRAINSAEYTANFTPPAAPLTAGSNKLLLNFTNAGIIDNAMMNDLETVGNAQISTTQSKFGGSSMYFDGTGDYLVGPNLPWLNFGTGDFTIECWLRLGATNTARMIVTTNYNSTNGNGGWAFIYRGDISSLSLSVNSNVTYTKSWSPSANTWYHVAVARSGTNLRLFVDGTQIGTTSTSSDNITGATTLVVAGNLGGGTNLVLDGYIDDLRITAGVARYTANFTAPTAAFPTS